MSDKTKRWQYPDRADVPNTAKERVQVDKFPPSYPDKIDKLPRLNEYPFLFWDPTTFFPERPQVDKFQPSYPDYLFRRPPNNVGDFFFWEPLTAPVTTPPNFYPVYPDILFRRPPNNVTDTIFWNPNVTFPERVQFDKFGPSYPDYVFRAGRPSDFTLGFWGNTTPATIVSSQIPLRMRMGMGL